MGRERSLYWDTLKGFLIILVVFGHCGTAVGDNLLSVVYSFHMPLFILISGFFSKRTDVVNGGGYKRLIIIYLIFDIIYGLPELINGGLTVRRILQPTFALWYILSLIFWRLFLQLLPQKLIDKKVLMLVTSIVIALAVGFIPVGNELAFQRTFTYWPFFLSGYYIKRDGVIDKIRSCNKWVALSVCAILFVVIYMYVPVMYSHSHYGNIPDDTITRGLQLIMAFCLCFCLMVIGREKLPILTELGKYTLIIYLLHPPIVKLMKVACIKVGHQPNILTSIIITAITIALIYAIKNLKIFKYLR